MSTYDVAVFDQAVFDDPGGVDPSPTPDPAPAAPAVVHLEELWINDVVDPSRYLVVPVHIDSTRTWTVPGETVDYAGGRTVAITREGVKRTWTPALGYQSEEDARRLEALASIPQWVRDPVGGKVLAVFYTSATKLVGELTSDRYGSCQHAVVSLTWTEISPDELATG